MVVNLPEVKIDAEPEIAPPIKPQVPTIAPAPPGRINVISPTGETGDLPIDWFLKEGAAKGYKLPQASMPEPSIEDLTDDLKNVKVIRKSDGSAGTVPLDWYLKDPNAKNYELASKADLSSIQAHNQKVQQDLADLNKREEVSSVFDASAGKALSARHKNDDVQDKDGNYKMLAPNGDSILVPAKQVTTLLSSGAGFKFQDDNYQALYEAYQQQKGGVKGGVWQSFGGITDSLPFHNKGKFTESILSNPKQDLVNKAERMVEDIEANDSDSYKLGQGLGIAAQVLTPGGVFGEMKAAQAVGAATLAKLAPEGASLARQIVARGVAGALEGMIVSSPQAIAQAAIDQNLKGAAESLALGAGIGSVLGVGTKLFSAGAEKGVSFLKGALPERSLKAAGAEAATLDKLGTVENKESFIKSLTEKGLTGKSNTAEVNSALAELSAGEKLTGITAKLDQVAEPISLTSLEYKLAKAQESLSTLNPKLASEADALSTKFRSLTDTSGSISLENLNKFVKELGSEINWKDVSNKDVLNTLKKEIFNNSLNELFIAGDQAALKADAKVASEWVKNKAITELSQQMHQKLMEDLSKGMANTLNPIAKFITGTLTSKASTLAGYSFGGLAGGFLADTAIKPLAEMAESKLVQHYANNSSNTSKLTNWLIKNKTSQAIGSYLTLDAIHAITQRNLEIPTFVRNLAEKVPAAYLSQAEPIKTILGPDAVGLSKAQQFHKLSDQAAVLAGSPELRQQHLQEILSPIAANHPALAVQLEQDYNKKIEVLNNILNGKNNKEPSPFKKPEKYTPSKSEMKDIEDQLKIAMNPYALLDGLKNGKVTPKQVAVASQLNPEILNQIREELNKLAYSGKTNLTYQQRLSASIIMGQTMDHSLKSTPQLQNIYSMKNANEGRRGAKLNPQKMPQAQATLSQRLMGK